MIEWLVYVMYVCSLTSCTANSEFDWRERARENALLGRRERGEGRGVKGEGRFRR